MTRQQKRLLDFISARIGADGVSPSYDEMAAALGLRSKSGIHRLISGLEERGFIRRLPYRARSIDVVRRVCCPNCGADIDLSGTAPASA